MLQTVGSQVGYIATGLGDWCVPFLGVQTYISKAVRESLEAMKT